ncbi:hypothetical protein [Oerskovia turbata]
MRPSSARPASPTDRADRAHPASPTDRADRADRARPASPADRAPAARPASARGAALAVPAVPAVAPVAPVPADERGLRRAVLIDGVAGLVCAPLLVLTAVPLAEPFGLAVSLLVGTGIVLAAFGAFLWWTARRVPLSRGAVGAVLALNVAWMLASVVVLLVASPTPAGVVFVVGQGLAVLGITIAEAVGLCRADGAR